MYKPTDDIPKPLPCQQMWDDMIPVNGGRICNGCGKLVVDFRKHSWVEIERTQRENILPVCGIYKDQQIENWGVELSTPTTKCHRMLKLSAAFVAIAQLSSIDLSAQTNTIKQSSTAIQISNTQKTTKLPVNEGASKKILSGTIVTERADASKWPLACAQITVVRKTKTITTETDSFGRFALNLTDIYGSLPDTFEVVVTHPQFSIHTIKYTKKDFKSALSIVLPDQNLALVADKEDIVAYITSSSYYLAPPHIPLPVKSDQAVNSKITKQSKMKKWWQQLWKKDK